MPLPVKVVLQTYQNVFLFFGQLLVKVEKNPRTTFHAKPATQSICNFLMRLVLILSRDRTLLIV